jgi:polyvinyl alcohol dehydrogenase (cytochrome)
MTLGSREFILSCLTLLAAHAAIAQTGQCTPAAPLTDPGATPAWNGWGVDLSNSRFQPARAAQLIAAQLPQLKLKWAFGFPGVKSVMGQPSVVSGRVFLGVDTGAVYSLDAARGCLYWSFMADAAVRTAISIDRAGSRFAAFFGDL